MQGKALMPNGELCLRKQRIAILKICRNESFSFTAGASTPRMYVRILDHKTLGKDKVLGEADVDVSLILHMH